MASKINWLSRTNLMIRQFRAILKKSPYIILAFSIGSSIILLNILCIRLKISLINYNNICIMCFFLIISSFMAQQLSYLLLRNFLFSFSLIIFGAVLHPAIEHIGLRIDRHLISDNLVWIDSKIGFNWILYHNWIESHNIYRFLTLNSYNLFGFEFVVVPIILCFKKNTEILIKFFSTTSLSLLIIDILFVVWPADNATYLHGYFDLTPTNWHSEMIACILSRSTTYDVLDSLTGLVSFPSFHTAGCIINIWYLNKTRFFWLFLILNTVIIASVPVWGGHYCIDVISGGFVALTTISFVEITASWQQRIGIAK